MKLVLLVTGKTDQSWIKEGVAEYEKRISRYARFELITLPDIKVREQVFCRGEGERGGENAFCV